MHLPVPTTQDVASFRQLLREEFHIELTDDEAWDWATRTLQIFYLQHYSPINETTICDTSSTPEPTPRARKARTRKSIS